MVLHLRGDAEFARIFGQKDGLGPIFVQTSCEHCHAGDGKGNPFNNLTRFGKYDTDGSWNPMLELGGPQLQHRSVDYHDPERLPPGASSSQFIAPNVTGLGYLAAVEDATLLAMSDPGDADGDGISGTLNYIQAPGWLHPDPRYHTPTADGLFIGRFGRKAAAIDLLHQTVGAYKQDMGITSDFDLEDPVNKFSSLPADDGVADPEIPATTVNAVVFYLKTLKVPPRREADDPRVTEGSRLFEQIGCAACHRPSLQTGPSEIAALNRVTFHPYTDLLMHDMGNELDDSYTEGTATTSEWRTTPLWGLGLQQDSQGGKAYLMHDGRAGSYEEAILLHGGEAAGSRKGFTELSVIQKENLYRFLGSL